MRPILTVCLGLLSVSMRSEVAAQEAVQFPHGVSSGDVSHSHAVLWTRTNRSVPVTLELSDHPAFERPIVRKTFATSAADDFVARADVYALQAATTYYFRWLGGTSVSDTGRFRTAPLPWQPQSVRFAWAGDSDGTMVNGVPAVNRFESLDALRKEDPDFFIYLGDTIYADSEHRGPFGPARTLDEFRQAYKVNRGFPALRQLLQSTSAFVVWDDHEVADNWNPETVDPSLLANGRRAFLEFMPVSAPVMPRDPGCTGQPMFRYFRWGAGVDIIVLDERSCRSSDASAACASPLGGLDPAPQVPLLYRALYGYGQPPPGCLAALADPRRTLLGPTQKWLFKYYLQHSTARFKFVISELPIQQGFFEPYDRWEGYGADRMEILEFIRDHRIPNVIFLAADAHANIVNKVVIDIFADSTPLAYEFISGPIATETLQEAVGKARGIQPETANLALSALGIDCWDLNSFGYGLVEADAASGTVRVSLKGQDGQVLHSQYDPQVECAKTFGP